MLPAAADPMGSTADQADHLDWCMPGACETAGGETLHRSAPIVWRMDGDDADVFMRRCQCGASSGVFYEVHLEHRAFAEEVTLTMSEHDVNRLFTGVHELRECR